MVPRKSRSPNGGLAARTGWIGSVARFWEKTYAPDYVGFTLLLTAYLLVVFLVDPFHRMFFINNINILYPHALVERVSVPWNIIYAGVIPFICLIAWLGITRASFHKFHVTLLGFFISIFLTNFITDSIKNAVGRPRPDLIARCKPAAGTPIDILVTIAVCTETDPHTLQDGWRSFPSGHSSFAFSGLGFLALFFAGQMHVFRPRTDLSKTLLAIAPLLGAAMIAISRCEDYRHDVYDVTCGSILGMSLTYFSYRRYYPRLSSPKCDEPFESREVIFNEGFGKIKNDEELARSARDFELSDDEESTRYFESLSYSASNIRNGRGWPATKKLEMDLSRHIFFSVVDLPRTGYQISYRYLLFCIDFFKAALGDDAIQEPCIVVKLVHSPIKNLGYWDYFRLQRCLGNEAGFDIQGEVMQRLRGFLGGFGNHPILFLLLVTIFFFYVLPCILDMVVRISRALISIPIRKAFWPISVVSGLVIIAVWNISQDIYLRFIVGTILIILILIFLSQDFRECLKEYWHSFVAYPIINAPLNTLGWVFGIVGLLLQVVVGWFPKFHRVPVINHENDIKERTDAEFIDPTDHRMIQNQYLAAQQTIQELQSNISRLENDLDHERQERAHFQNAVKGGDSSVAQLILQRELNQSRNQIAQLEEQKDDIELRNRNIIKAMEIRIDNLQVQVNWARGAGEERSTAVAKLDNAQIQIRRLISENEKLILEESQMRKELAYEKISGPKSECHNDGKCQNDIRRLQNERNLLQQRHVEHEQMVQEALRYLSYQDVSGDFGNYLLVPSFIRQAAKELLRRPALGQQGYRTEDIQVSLLQANLTDERRLNARLKDECERLGGNVTAVELGLDTRPPPQTRTEQMTYEEEAHRVFEFYIMLTKSIGDLKVIFGQLNIFIPAIEDQIPRNDQTSLESGQQHLSWEQLAISNEFTNPTISTDEILKQKLVLNEMQRWYNYGLFLAFLIKEHKKSVNTQTLDHGALEIFKLIEWIENNANNTFNEIGKYVLDDTRKLIQSNSDRAPQPRQKHKFKIYLAMQRCITELTLCVIENRRVPPLWNFIATPPYLNDPLTTIDNLTANLVNFEIFVLESRINQLVRYAEETRLPGTNTGPPMIRIQGDAEYEIRWNKIVLAQSYSELAISHWKLWNDQKETIITEPQTGQTRTEWLLEGRNPKPFLLPLRWEEFRDSVFGKIQSGQKILDESIWPGRTQILFQHDPSIGPRFRVQVLPDPVMGTINNTNNQTNTNKNTGTITTNSNNQAQLMEHVEELARRIEQLKHFITHNGLRGSMVLPNLGKGPRKNESLEELKRRVAMYDQHINALTKKLKDNSIRIPKAPHKGGPMWP